MTPLAPLTMQELKLNQTLDGANMSPYHTTGEFATSLVLLRFRAESCTPVSLSIRFLLSLSQLCACPTNIYIHICLKCVLHTNVSIVNREIKPIILRSLFVKSSYSIHLCYLMSLQIKNTHDIKSHKDNSIPLSIFFSSFLYSSQIKIIIRF